MSSPRTLAAFFQKTSHLHLSFPEFLSAADSICSVSDKKDDTTLVEKFARLFLEKFEKDLIARKNEWHDRNNRKLQYVISQLQAIALLTGLRSELFDNPDFPLLHRAGQVDALVENNFLHKKTPLKFNHFDRALLTMQLLVRVGDFSKINQREEPVCGPNTFILGVASQNALRYVNFVTELAEFGKSVIKLESKQPGLQIEISQNNFDHAALSQLVESADESDSNPIHEADFIPLIGLRSYFNYLVSYQNDNPAFGITFPSEIETWMRLAGYNHLNRFKLRSVEDIKRCERLIKYGYSVTFFTTVRMTQQMLDEELTDTMQGTLWQLLNGHVVTLQSLRYREATQQVEATVISWGQQSQQITIPLHLFFGKTGLCEVVAGQSPQTERNLLLSARQHGRRLHPYYYCVFIKKYIRADFPTFLNKEQTEEVNALLTFIEKNQHSLAFPTWTSAAKKLQDLIYDLQTKYKSDPSAKQFCSWLQNHLAYSIADEDTIEIANTHLKRLIAPNLHPDKCDSVNLHLSSFHQLNVKNLHAKGIRQRQIESMLGKGLELRDIDLVRFQIEFYIHNNQYNKITRLLESIKKAAWLNKYDRDVCDAALFSGIKNKIYDLSISQSAPTGEEMSVVLELKNKVKDPKRQKELDACLNMLVARKLVERQKSQSIQTTLNPAASETSAANQFFNYAEMWRMYLYHLNVFLDGANELNKRLYPDLTYLNHVNQAKMVANTLASEFFKFTSTPDFTRVEEIREKCFLTRNFLLQVISSIPKPDAQLKAEFVRLKTDVHANFDPNVFVRNKKLMNLRLAELTRLGLMAFQMQLAKTNRPQVNAHNTNPDPREDMNRRLFQQNFNLDRIRFYLESNIRRIMAALMGMVTGAILGAGLGAWVLPVVFSLVLTMFTLIGILLATAAVVAMAGWLIGRHLDMQAASTSLVALEQPKIDPFCWLYSTEPTPVIDPTPDLSEEHTIVLNTGFTATPAAEITFSTAPTLTGRS